MMKMDLSISRQDENGEHVLTFDCDVEVCRDNGYSGLYVAGYRCNEDPSIHLSDEERERLSDMANDQGF